MSIADITDNLGSLVKKPTMPISRLWEYVTSISPNNASISWQEANASIAWDIPYQYVYDAIALILGYAYTTPGPGRGTPQNPTRIYRKNPVRHPLFSWMVATKIESIVGQGPAGKVATYNPFGLANVPPYTESYELYRITAQFSSPPYQILENEYASGGVDRNSLEQYRYFWREGIETNTSFITLEGGRAKFAPGQGTISNTPIDSNGGKSVSEVQQVFKYRWTYVPIEYVEPAFGFGIESAPDKLTYCLNKVNSITFKGFTPGTLLMEPFEYTLHRMPINTNTGQPKWWVDIGLNLRYFEPVKSPDCTAGKSGHLLAPGPNGLYYYAIRSDGGGDLYQGADFNKIFTPPEDVF